MCSMIDDKRANLFSTTERDQEPMATDTNSSGETAAPNTSDTRATAASSAPETTTGPRTAASIRGQKAAATRKRNAAVKAAKETRGSARATATTAQKSAKATRATARRTATEAGQTAEATVDAVEAEAKVRVNQVQQLAEKLVLVQVGAGLTVRDNVVSTVKGIRETVTDPSTVVQRRLTRYEKRGAKARNRFERQVRTTRKRFERDLRQQRSRVQSDLRAARNDISRQSGALGSRVERIVSDAQHKIGSVA
jgi:hypothetical protein